MDQASDLKELLVRIVQNQNDSALMLNAMQADVETLRLTPVFAENLGRL
jgi:hypothetical protein